MKPVGKNGTSGAGGLGKCPTGMVGLDQITNGGLPQGRPALVCGGAGCGKTLLAVEFIVRGATQFNEPGVFISFEETSEELTKKVRSLGFDLDDLIRRKKLAMDFVRVERSEIEETGEYDLGGLFVRLNHAIESVGAKRVVLDTIESLFSGLSNTAILRAELRRLFRWLKDKGVTAIITGEKGEGTLTRQGIEEYVSDCVIMLDHRIHDQLSTRRLRVVKYRGSIHGTNEYPFIIDEQGISVLPVTSLGLDHPAGTIDTWLFVRDIELGGERNRGMYVLKSRGMAHSNQIREFVLGKHGVELLDVYVGSSGVLTGSVRLAQEAKEQAQEVDSKRQLHRQQTEAQARRKALEAQIAALQAQVVAENQAIKHLTAEEQAMAAQEQAERTAMAKSRKADVVFAAPGNSKRKGGRP